MPQKTTNCSSVATLLYESVRDQLYYAEILYHQLEDYREAITQYKAVMLKDKKGKFIEDAALGVITPATKRSAVRKFVNAVTGKGGASIEKIKPATSSRDRPEEESEKIERTRSTRLSRTT